MTATYDYVFLTLERGLAARRAFLQGLAEAKETIALSGGEVLGLFFPQLGWEAAEVALLVRWRGERDELSLEAVTGPPQVIGVRCDSLKPTLRPEDTAKLRPGGIYVHRWFETPAPDLQEFLKLSGEGWQDFEPRFDVQVFGLFLADETEDDQASRSRRLLLITRYADHGVWEASRNPSTEGMQVFARRALITLRTTGASTLFEPV